MLENGADIVSDTGGIDTATSTVSRWLAGGGLTTVEKLTLVNVATALKGYRNSLDNVITGNSFVNKLYGGAGNDWLNGGAGNNTLTGGAGNDMLIGGPGRGVMRGGPGNDIFRFGTTSHSRVGNPDVITDFDKLESDRIDVAALFGPHMAYIHDAVFTAVGQVRINDIAGPDVLVEVNTGGSLAADFQIRMTNTTLASMSTGDFFL